MTNVPLGYRTLCYYRSVHSLYRVQDGLGQFLGSNKSVNENFRSQFSRVLTMAFHHSNEFSNKRAQLGKTLPCLFAGRWYVGPVDANRGF